jgi:transposase
MHIDQQPGEHLYVDFAGKKLEVVNPVTGEIRPVEVYVALLGYSQLTYVEATQSQKIPDFINASENAVHFFGGSPRVVVCDNLKTAIKKASTYEPDVNETFMDFANHYHMSVIPARPHKPKDKPLVENAVKIVYSRVYAALRHRTFFSLAELNQAIRECVEKHNRILFQGLQESRWDRFEAREKVILQTLPVNRFEIKTFVEHTVQKNCHIRLGEDKNYYSVPYRYIGQKVRVIYTQNTVSIYSQGQRIAFHSRSFKAGFYTTVPEHLTSAHRFYLDWSPEKFIQWALDMGEDVADYIKKVLDTKPHPEQAYKSCLGILTLAKKDSRENLRAACKRASELGIYNYSIIKNQLQNKSFLLNDEEQEKSCQYKLPFHENIRGASFYQ